MRSRASRRRASGLRVLPSAFAPGALPVPSRLHIRPSAHEVLPLGQDAPHLDGRAYAVGSQARPAGESPPRRPWPAPQRREDIRRQGPCRRRQPGRRRGRQHRLARGPLGARPCGQGRRDPPECRCPAQVAADPQGQRGARWRAGPGRRQGREADRQGRRPEGRQGPHRGEQVGQGQGRPDCGRQGPRRVQQDRSRRGRRGQGRRGRRSPAAGETAVATKPAAKAPTKTAAAKPAAKSTATKASASKTAAKTTTKKPAAKKS